ncbi:MAG: fructose-bisphosphate aldolase, class [Actinomycetota bacterium]|nr:fructose-bisphosphate aldolase, class [Actinomycetota bacterium]
MAPCLKPAPRSAPGGDPLNREQFEKVKSGDGFIAALDQSGGSTPKALRLYGVEESSYSNDDEMFALIHEMRARIVTSPAFNGDRILGAILFEQTLDREIGGRSATDYLWAEKNVVPFLKVDKGLADEADGVQLMKPMPDLDKLLDRALEQNVFGTKMRSVVKLADPKGIEGIVEQQFEIGQRIADRGLVPILEPEIDIKSPQKSEAEALLRDHIMKRLEEVPNSMSLLFKLTLPEEDNFYSDLVDHPKVVRVVALSGGYSRDEANARLSRNKGVVASFSRALTADLSVDQSDAEFNAALEAAIASIYAASIA